MDHGFFLILDVAIGGGFPNGVCNCSTPVASTSSGAAMSVGYVAVYTTSGSGGTHDVYLEFSSGAGGNPPFVSLHWFNFPAH